jgi:hypothetical protein
MSPTAIRVHVKLFKDGQQKDSMPNIKARLGIIKAQTSKSERLCHWNYVVLGATHIGDNTIIAASKT